MEIDAEQFDPENNKIPSKAVLDAPRNNPRASWYVTTSQGTIYLKVHDYVVTTKSGTVYVVPKNILESWRHIGKHGATLEKKWLNTLDKKNSKIKKNLENILDNKNLKNLDQLINSEKEKYFKEKPAKATRECSSLTIEAVSSLLPELIGGSADLSGSNNTKTKNSKVVSSKDFNGNYIHYGIREHGMAASMNGLALYGGLIPFGGTFLIFSDYCKPSIRLSALMGLKVIYIFSHDSIGLGEDGPTHQPIEQLAGLRAIPN